MKPIMKGNVRTKSEQLVEQDLEEWQNASRKRSDDKEQ
jgi:hypothetical protein